MGDTDPRPSEETLRMQATLADPAIHRQWAQSHRLQENERFYQAVFDYLADILKPLDSPVLDAGCGSCAQSMRLAQRGFQVHAMDVSEAALEMAAENIRQQGLQDKITLKRGNLLSLPFSDGTFQGVLCWGVLMHIPEVERALAELTRVVKPGGLLVISENNMNAMDVYASRLLKKFKRSRMLERKPSPGGVEQWLQTPGGPCFLRSANLRWLRAHIEKKGFAVRAHRAGELTEIHCRLGNRTARACVHRVNRIWFNYIRIPWPAAGNLLIFQKQAKA
jgi:ubiquinone/menaquinone biosynthesis C-methylase UbiE